MRSTRDDLGNTVYSKDTEKALVRAQYTRVWEESMSRRLRIEEGLAGELVAKSLVRLNEIDPGISFSFVTHKVLNNSHRIGLFDAAWDTFAPGMKVHSFPAEAPNTQLLFSLLKASRAVLAEESHPRSVIDDLFQNIMERVLSYSRNALLSQTQDEDNQRKLDVLLDMIDTFGDDLFDGTGPAEVRRPVADNLFL
jgi:E3 ubiquitin-protein ligase listerin